MKADELNCRARLRAHARDLVRDLRRLGYTDEQLRGRSILELDDLHYRGLTFLMGAPDQERDGGGDVA